jgi:hypothetical protein
MNFIHASRQPKYQFSAFLLALACFPGSGIKVAFIMKIAAQHENSSAAKFWRIQLQ